MPQRVRTSRGKRVVPRRGRLAGARRRTDSGSTAARARLARAAEMEIAGQPDRVPTGRLVSVGKVLDPHSRTLPDHIRVRQPDARIACWPGRIPSSADGDHATPPVVPAAAIVDDAGRPIVFVQREGETFERRAVTLGRDRETRADHGRSRAGRSRGDKRRVPRAPRLAVDVGSGPWTRALTEL